MRKIVLAIGLVFLIASSALLAMRGGTPDSAAEVEGAPASSIVDETLAWERISIEDGDTFARIMERLGVPYADTLAVLAAAEGVFDFTMIRLGRDVRYVMEEGRIVRLAYDVDTEDLVRVERIADGFAARRESIPYTVTRATASGTITISLYEDALASGMPEVAVLALASAFAWTVDFATQVQQGDTFRVLYEHRARNGAPAGIGRLLAAEFINAGTAHTAFLFEDSAGKPAYFDADGNSLARQLLRAPLEYGRITSGFTFARFHPTLGATTPHRAIDYAAPFGTPVRSVGDGTVNVAGWNGGHGNYISIRHNDTYETHYAHLSGYARGIRKGATVTQGQVIGFVGSTGYSTGSHVHYEIAKWGTLINPLTLELPPVEPVAEARRAEFVAARDALRALLP